MPLVKCLKPDHEWSCIGAYKYMKIMYAAARNSWEQSRTTYCRDYGSDFSVFHKGWLIDCNVRPPDTRTPLHEHSVNLSPSTWLHDMAILHSVWSWSLTWKGWHERGGVVWKLNNFEWQKLSFSCLQLSMYVVPWPEHIDYFCNLRNHQKLCKWILWNFITSNIRKHPVYVMNVCFYRLLNRIFTYITWYLIQVYAVQTA